MEKLLQRKHSGTLNFYECDGEALLVDPNGNSRMRHWVNLHWTIGLMYFNFFR